MNKKILFAALMCVTAAVSAEEFNLNKVDAAGAAKAAAGTALPDPGRPAASGTRVYAEGHLYAYNRATKQYDTDMSLRCSVTLENFKSYLDTQHGSPREVVSADYRLGGFPELAKYAAGNSVASAPDKYSDYVNLQGYYQSGLSKGVDVNIFIDKVPSAQAFLANPGTPLDVYVTMENSAASYFGGNGVKWGYWCNFRQNTKSAANSPVDEYQNVPAEPRAR